MRHREHISILARVRYGWLRLYCRGPSLRHSRRVIPRPQQNQRPSRESIRLDLSNRELPHGQWSTLTRRPNMRTGQIGSERSASYSRGTETGRGKRVTASAPTDADGIDRCCRIRIADRSKSPPPGNEIRRGYPHGSLRCRIPFAFDRSQRGDPWRELSVRGVAP
jgi:hypothetical protein